MNLTNFKLPADGTFQVGIRIQLPEIYFARASFGSGLMTGPPLTEIIRLRLEAAGEPAPIVALTGNIFNCTGIMTLVDLEQGLGIARQALSKLGLVPPFVQFLLYDPSEMIFRPLDAGESRPFDLESVIAKAKLDMGTMTEAAQTVAAQLRGEQP